MGSLQLSADHAGAQTDRELNKNMYRHFKYSFLLNSLNQFVSNPVILTHAINISSHR